MANDFKNFEEFWPFYISEHNDRTCRQLHIIGTSGSIICMVLLVVTGNPVYILSAMLSGYGCAWIGHFVFEGNRPASFKQPLWSLRGDFRMWWQTVVTRELPLPARHTEQG